LTEGLDESAPRAKAGFSGNELEEHELDEAIEDQGEPRQMHAIRLTPHASDDAILGIESIGIIEQSEKTRRPIGKLLATRAVNSQVDVALGASRCEAGWSLRRVQGTLGLATDTQHMGYVLRKEETGVPAGLMKALENANRLQDIVMANMKPGPAGTKFSQSPSRKCARKD
jgi:hypothetical protein